MLRLDTHQLLIERGDEGDDLIRQGHRMTERLLQKLHEHLTLGQEITGVLIEIRGELREDGHLTILREIDTERAGGLLHGLRLRRTTDSGYRQTDVDGRTLTLEEEVALEEDLTIGDGDDVRRDIGRHITILGLDDRKCGDGATTELLTETAGTLEESRVQIEDITRVRLTSRRTAEKQRQRSVGDGMLTEVIVDDQDILSLVHEVLGEGGRCIRCDVLDRRRIGRGGRHDAGVLHRIVLLQVLDQ